MATKRDASWDETVQRGWPAEWERHLRRGLYQLLGFFLQNSAAHQIDLSKCRKLLLVKEPYRMGDLLQITPTLRTLKEYFPQLQIDLVVQDRNAILFRHNPHLTHLWVYEKKLFNQKPWKIFSWMRAIRREHYDCAVTLETQRAHLTNDLITFFSGAPQRLAYDAANIGHAESNVFYNVLTPNLNSADHETQKNFNVFQAANLKMTRGDLEIFFSEQDAARARQILEEKFDPNFTDKKIVALHPGAYKHANRWPLANYFELAQRLAKKNLTPLFFLGPAEIYWRDKIESAGFASITDVSVLEMVAIFKHCAAVCCNDTGVLHLSAGVDALTLGLFGPTVPGPWKPPNSATYALAAPTSDITTLSIDLVEEELLQLLKKIKP